MTTIYPDIKNLLSNNCSTKGFFPHLENNYQNFNKTLYGLTLDNFTDGHESEEKLDSLKEYIHQLNEQVEGFDFNANYLLYCCTDVELILYAGLKLLESSFILENEFQIASNYKPPIIKSRFNLITTPNYLHLFNKITLSR